MVQVDYHYFRRYDHCSTDYDWYSHRKKVLIPWISVTLTTTKLPFVLERRQYPIKVCYAMTINKSQGQILSNVGIYLKKPVFTHG
jgi:ATP-dependent exoDNAse (exonuclease V) alpha subunit